MWRSVHEGRPGFVTPAIVVEDSEETIALFQPTGSTFKDRAGERGGPRGRNHLPGSWDGTYSDNTWTGPGCLRVHVPGTAISILRWWHPDLERYEGWGWYVNLELPWQRTPIGFDSRDLLLDIVIEEDLTSWRWKDEDELAWAIEEHLMDDATAALTRAAGHEALAMLEQRAFPFNADWDRWRPEPNWPLPAVPDGWDGPGLTGTAV